MKYYIKSVLILSFLCTSNIILAFPGDIGSGTSGTNDPPAPIGDYLFVLAFLGIGLVVWYNYKKTQKI